MLRRQGCTLRPISLCERIARFEHLCFSEIVNSFYLCGTLRGAGMLGNCKASCTSFQG